MRRYPFNKRGLVKSLHKWEYQDTHPSGKFLRKINACAPMAGYGGFSLVELSIVLVILGLLVGGILTGQNLIKAAELRSVTQDVNKYQAAVYSFRDKYQALPGDMPNAVRFWGAQAGTLNDGPDSTCMALDVNSPATGEETCNGNGNGQVSGAGWYEIWRFWQHLANAGLTEGQYAGVPGDATVTSVGIAGFNMPPSRASQGAGFAVTFIASVTTSGGALFPGPYGNVMRFGGHEGVDQDPGLITPEDAWNIDTKMDDGKPGTGDVRTYANNTRPDCTSTDVAATAEYLVQGTISGCNLFFMTGF